MKGIIILVLLAAATYTEASRRVSVATLVQARQTTLNSRNTMTSLLSSIHLSGHNSLVTTRTFTTALGIVKERLQQTYGGLEVVGGGVAADYSSSEGYAGLVSGEVYTELEQDIPDPYACNQTEDVVTQVAFADAGADASIVENLDVKKNIYTLDGKAHVTYEVNFFFMDGRTPKRPCYFIDACDLSVVEMINNIQTKAVNRNRVRRQAAGDDECTAEPETTTQDQCEGETTQRVTTQEPITQEPTTQEPTTQEPTTQQPTTQQPTTQQPTTQQPTTQQPTTQQPTTQQPTSCTNPAVGVGGNTKIGRNLYGGDNVCLDTIVTGTTCRLENENVRVIDMKQRTDKSSFSTAEYTCSQGYSDQINGAYSAVLDAIAYGTASVNMYKEWYNLVPLTFKPPIYVHYDRNYENAFWNGNSLTFGDGYSYFYPLVSLDVVAHELGHGVTTRFSNLIYNKQSGGINEAFSDIAGEATKMYHFKRNDWLLGYDIKKGSGALRYMADPPRDGISKKHVDDYNDNVNVHHSSGIFNKAFHELVQVLNMPMKDAFHCFLHANMNYWGQSTTFEQGACGVMKSCYDLGFAYTKVRTAFQTVGITFSNCAISTFMESLSPGQTLRQVSVSSSKKPIIMLSPPQGSSDVTVTVSAPGNVVIIDLFDSPETGSPLISGEDQVTYQFASPSLYLQLSSESEDTTVIESVHVTYQ